MAENIMYVCHTPFWEYCDDLFLASDILDFLEFHEKYMGEWCSEDFILKAMNRVLKKKITRKHLTKTLHELIECARVERKGSQYKLR